MIHTQLEKKEELYMNQSKNTIIQENSKNQILKFFNIMYKNVRYRSLKNLRRPFMFAYSAFTN